MRDLGHPRSSQILSAGIAGWFGFLAVDFVAHGVLLASYWKSTAEYWRPSVELFRMVPVGYLSFAIYCGLLVWLLVRLSPAAPDVSMGLRWGTFIGFLYSASSILGTYSVFRMPSSAVVIWTVVGTIESAVAGAAIGWVLSSPHPARRALCVTACFFGAVIAGILFQNLLK